MQELEESEDENDLELAGVIYELDVDGERYELEVNGSVYEIEVVSGNFG